MENSIDDLDGDLGGMVGADGKYSLSSDTVVLLKKTVGAIITLEGEFDSTTARINAMVANLRKVCESNSRSVMSLGATVAVVHVDYSHYVCVRALFLHTWGSLRKMELPLKPKDEKTCSKAFERYYADTGLAIPLSDNPKSVAKREKEQAEAKRLEAIPDLEVAKLEAVARDDMKEATAIIDEKKRREKLANQGTLERLAPKKSDLAKLIKDSIDENKLDMVLAWYKGSVKLVAEKKVSRAV